MLHDAAIFAIETIFLDKIGNLRESAKIGKNVEFKECAFGLKNLDVKL